MTSDWHHRPRHVFLPRCTYMVTAGTLHKQPVFRGATRLSLLRDELLRTIERFNWDLRAWAVFPNHYHLVAVSPDDGDSLRALIQAFHSATARGVNKLDQEPGRKVWFQYWDTCIAHDSSYFARMHYVITNPVKHGIVQNADDYLYGCSRWIEEREQKSFLSRVRSYRCDTVRVVDDF